MHHKRVTDSMFVFPAFDSNYKTRKRTFKCCRTCRARRLKCIQSNDYETEGCDICDKDGYVCDLIKKDVSNPVVAGGESGGKGLLLSTQDSERVPDHHSPLPSGGGGRSLNGHIRPNEYGIGYPATSHNYYTLPPPDSIRLSSIANQGNQSNSQPYLESAPLPSAYLYDTRTYQSDRISNEFRHHQPQQYTQHQHQHQRHHRYIQPRMNQYLKQPSLAIPDYKNFRLQLPDQIPPARLNICLRKQELPLIHPFPR